MGSIVGIDLGTTNTVVAAVSNGQATALANRDGQVLIPSVVSFHPSGNVLVGPEAKARRRIDAHNTIYSVKRLIGRSWDSAEVREARQRFPFEMREGPGQAALVVARKETYTLPEISAFVLRKAKTVAEEALGSQIERAVITVPANFNDLQRAATKVAGRVAGLEVMRILNEPTAAALAYGYGKASSERLAVYDFGGGTLDITLLDLADNVFEVLATAGNTFLGGDDIDHAISERMADELLAMHRVDARADQRVFELLRAAAEDLKQRLSVSLEASVLIEEVAHQTGGKALDFKFAMTRAELNHLMTPIVDKTFDVCREAMGIARLGPDDFDQVLLVGGSTRIPLVRGEVERFFKRTPITHLRPDEVVAIGAAIQANALTGAERRQSNLPLPPHPAKSTKPPRRRQSTLPIHELPPDAASAAADTASYGRPRLQTAPGLQPSSPVPLPARQRIAPLVVPPGTGQPRSGVPITENRAGLPKRTTATGLGQAPVPPVQKPPAVLAPPVAPALDSGRGATLKSAAAEASAARESLERGQAHTQRLFGSSEQELAPDGLPLVLPGGPVGAESAELLDDADLEELETGLFEATRDDDEETLARARPSGAGTLIGLESGLPAPVPTFDQVPTLDVAARSEPAPSPELPRPQQPVGHWAPSLDLSPPHGPTPAPTPEAQALAGLTLALDAPAPVIRQVTLAPPLLIDVTPLTLAVETVGGYCDTVIERNSPIPCEKSRQFATVHDNQDSVRVRVSQGESSTFSQNTLLGEVVLSGLRRAPRGGVKIDVNFALDTSGMLNVNASDVATGRSVSTRIRLVGLADALQIEAMQARHAAHPVS